MKKYLLIIIIMRIFASILFSQESSNKSPEYIFTYDKENNFNIADTNAINEISIMIERRGFPLVNRLVRFTSLNPDIFQFEIEKIDNIKELEFSENEDKSYTNIFVVPTDEDGIARAKLNLIKSGNAIVLMHILYVGSTGNTNISYEEFAYINIKDNFFQSKILNVEDESLNKKSSVIIIATLFPALFLISIALIFISYFRRIYYEYRNIKSKIVIYTFFGFSSIKKQFLPMLILIFLELSIIGTSIIISDYIFSIILLALFIAGFTVKREKMYSIGFFILSCIFITHLYLQISINYLEMDFILQNNIISSPIFTLILFFIITSLTGGIYIPVSILTLYKVSFNLSDLSFILALVGIFLSSVFYIVKVKKDIPFLYELDLIKIKD
ncbi:hypothetical protein [Brachyspira aalborgi]|uniref:hypothetical protein n=1 Tax=Brachyspira aalborgi TaxID=29522 RepID=UPI00266C3E7C|nr:hypothetical protein [Brachyspira aalborgi]